MAQCYTVNYTALGGGVVRISILALIGLGVPALSDPALAFAAASSIGDSDIRVDALNSLSRLPATAASSAALSESDMRDEREAELSTLRDMGSPIFKDICLRGPLSGAW
jgi:hypothetical protein